MNKPVAPQKDDYINYQCYLDAYEKYVEAHDRYYELLASENSRSDNQKATVMNWRKYQSAELDAMKRRDAEDALFAYASLQELKRDQWRERMQQWLDADATALLADGDTFTGLSV